MTVGARDGHERSDRTFSPSTDSHQQSVDLASRMEVLMTSIALSRGEWKADGVWTFIRDRHPDAVFDLDPVCDLLIGTRDEFLQRDLAIPESSEIRRPLSSTSRGVERHDSLAPLDGTGIR